MTPVPASPHARNRAGRVWAALSGVLAAAAAVGAASLVAAFTRPADSPLISVGSTFIDLTPVWLKDFAIERFGTADKTVLLVTIGVVLLLAAVGAGLLAPRHPVGASVVIAAIGLAGAVTARTRPGGSAISVLPSVVGAVVGIVCLQLLTDASAPRPAPATSGRARSEADPEGVVDRRAVLVAGLGVAVLAAVSGGIGTVVGAARTSVEKARAAIRLPRPGDPAAPLPAGVSSGVAGTTPFVVPNADFYRVDTNLVVPSVDPATWTLTIGGMVQRPYSINFAELLAMPMVERYLTLTCVSNEVGGQYAGNARWLGVRLTDLLHRAGLDPAADQLLCTAVDGWTSSAPVQPATDGRDALVCVGMNGEPLPPEHGFPVRMVIPGLYGFVSACKWLVSIEATTYAQTQAYWTERGWATDAPGRTMARIEVPAPLSLSPPGLSQSRAPRGRSTAGSTASRSRSTMRPGSGAARGRAECRHVAAVVVRVGCPAGAAPIRARATDGTGQTQPEAPAVTVPERRAGMARDRRLGRLSRAGATAAGTARHAGSPRRLPGSTSPRDLKTCSGTGPIREPRLCRTTPDRQRPPTEEPRCPQPALEPSRPRRRRRGTAALPCRVRQPPPPAPRPPCPPSRLR